MTQLNLAAVERGLIAVNTYSLDHATTDFWDSRMGEDHG